MAYRDDELLLLLLEDGLLLDDEEEDGDDGGAACAGRPADGLFAFRILIARGAGAAAAA